MPDTLEIVTRLFLQLAAILAVARVAGWLLRRVGQTQVIAEILAGVLLGPSLLGVLAPALQVWLFPESLRLAGTEVSHPSATVLHALGQLGIVLYMFLMGLDLDTGFVARRLRAAGTIAAAGIGVPLLLGGALGWWLARDRDLFSPALAGWQAALFLSAALAITAFPVLARILHDLGLTRTELGAVALSAAASNDVVAWCLLAVVLASVDDTPATAVLAIAGALGYAVAMLTVGRRALARLFPPDDAGEASSARLAVLVMLVLLAAALTERIGIHGVFGAFLLGAVLPRGAQAARAKEALEPVTLIVLVPAFFVASGLSTDVALLLDGAVLGLAALVIVAGFAAKAGACTLAGRLAGSDWRTSAGIGALMNARGLMELVLINIGLDRGLITPTLFTILVLLTIVTTMLAAPLFRLVYR